MTPSEELAYELAYADAQLVYGLKEARIAQGIGEEQFAASLGVSLESLRAFEGGQTALNLGSIRRYAHGLGVVIEHSIEPFEPGRAAAREAASSPVVTGENSEDSNEELSPAAEAIRAAQELQAEKISSALTAVRGYTVDHGDEFRPLSTRILATLEGHSEHNEADLRVDSEADAEDSIETVDGEPEEELREEDQTGDEICPRDPAATFLELRTLIADYSMTAAAHYHSYHLGRLREMLAQLSVQS